MDTDERPPSFPPLRGHPRMADHLALLGRDALDPFFCAPPVLDPDPATCAILPFLAWVTTLARPRRIGIGAGEPAAITALLRDVARRRRLTTGIHALPPHPAPPHDPFDLLYLDVRNAPMAHPASLLTARGAVLLHGRQAGWAWPDGPSVFLPLGDGLVLATRGPGPLAALCALLAADDPADDHTPANIVHRFAAIGAHWAARRHLVEARADLALARQDISRLRLDAMELRLALNRQDTPPPVPAAPPPAPPAVSPGPLRRIAGALARRLRPPAPDAPPGRRPIRHVLFVSGEPETPGTLYRVTRNAAACRAAGFDARCRDCAAVGADDVHWADLIVLWRVEFSGHVDTLMALARARGTVLAFDADDIVFEPSLARADLIDGIRTTGAPVAQVERLFSDMQRTLRACDLGVAPTPTLAGRMRPFTPLTFVWPNTYDAETLRRSRHALRRRAACAPDGLVRIGYATGTRTHQRDFRQALAGLLRVMDQRPTVRLVLFREAGGGRPLLLTDEFPELRPHAARIEWRDMVPLAALPDELARLDISIAPLEVGNPFCEAKSELKFFEAALAGVCSVVSPTAPFRDAVRHGVTGLLADGATEWADALLTLVDDPALRRRMARDAFHTVLWDYGPQRQAGLLAPAIAGLTGDTQAARAGEIALARGAWRCRDVPAIPDSNILFARDQLRDAAVTVVVTAYNYADHVIEALESVRGQTLDPLDLIVVDDASSDDTAALLLSWAERHAARFNRLLILRAVRNAGLGGARNIGMAAAETPHILQLDADNRLLPEACATLRAAIGDAGYAYPIIRRFGRAQGLLGDIPFHPGRLVGGNRVDAMALVAKWAWAAAGGYYVQRDAMGWEDYDLWCTLAEHGIPGTHVPEILAEYRVHNAAMTDTLTEQPTHKPTVVTLLRTRHPWLHLTAPEVRNRS
ncbi:glycosyltransferase [Gluconacetobacter johannae DSM 13595]|uniref:Glycosyltransferase n=1 Tax=Gluconacetobacter johannae TaxID=112140 RepID=A0A7W4JA81_9PROT|nr:glycosyltransferase [Gluconacetobacter johannae]MBB2177486.1 glycosyltransferase [Gluconacetobacter johannae]GBQ85595.1 glycosyltransferase [Gluconacetobacter johannae DSM 13595]